MTCELFVANLSFHVDNARLKEIFSAAGEVQKAEVVTDRETGQSKGFGFVAMAQEEGAQAAITKLHGQEIDGRKLAVEPSKNPKRVEANPPSPEAPSGPQVLPGPDDLR